MNGNKFPQNNDLLARRFRINNFDVMNRVDRATIFIPIILSIISNYHIHQKNMGKKKLNSSCDHRQQIKCNKILLACQQNAEVRVKETKRIFF
ncbi:MAG: hypothetical protein B6244_05170 [Candidatus Cloacimonetes bacterium 4572_55]|nr:MAG: hypothetical protein B6244_05170 [Candidatus Cloacimonetes bacterium 4572_55]